MTAIKNILVVGLCMTVLYLGFTIFKQHDRERSVTANVPKTDLKEATQGIEETTISEKNDIEKKYYTIEKPVINQHQTKRSPGKNTQCIDDEDWKLTSEILIADEKKQSLFDPLSKDSSWQVTAKKEEDKVTEKIDYDRLEKVTDRYSKIVQSLNWL